MNDQNKYAIAESTRSGLTEAFNNRDCNYRNILLLEENQLVGLI